jgi:hypothetical protein
METNRKKASVKIDRTKIDYNFIDDAECPSKDCLECKNFTRCKSDLIRYSAMPQYLIDQSIKKLSPSAWKIYSFLNRRAGFGNDENFGKCWFTFKQVEYATGVKASNMGKYIRELIRQDLIISDWFVSNRKGNFKTVHTATIKWFQLHKELGLKFAQLQSIKTF